MRVVNRIKATGHGVHSSEIITKVLVSLPRKFATFRSNWEYNSTSDSTIEAFKEKLLVAELTVMEVDRNGPQETGFKAKVKEEEELDHAPDMALVAKTSSGDARRPRRDGNRWENRIWEDVHFVDGMTDSLFSIPYMESRKG